MTTDTVPQLVRADALIAELACGRPGCACHDRRRRTTHCPNHKDRTPSLGVDVRGERLLVVCRAGCRQADVIAALRARGLWSAAPASRPRREISPAELARRDVLAEARRHRARLAPFAETFGESDSLRVAYQTAGRARRVATALGDTEDAWGLLAAAVGLEVEAMNAEAPDGRRAC